jgi:predicted nuclease of predicted toxin-antitoxin system
MADAVRFYADQHYPAPVTTGLTRRAIDVLTAQDANQCAASDSDQLAFATSLGRVLLTFDSDFLAIHQSGESHAGIVWCPATKYSIGELIRMVVLLHAVVTAHEMVNHLEYL